MDNKNWALLGLFVVIISVFYLGISISFMWSWFIVPLGVREINLPWSIGLACLFCIFKGESSERIDADSGIWPLFRGLVYITYMNAIGFIVHFFI